MTGFKSEFLIGDSPARQVTIGRRAGLFVVCGPCVLESQQHAVDLAGQIGEVADRLGLPLIFKASYDKANRTALGGFRGMGKDAGLAALSYVRANLKIPVLTDVHSVGEVGEAACVVDVLQIPAFLCRQTDILLSAGKTGKPVLVKKGQFLAPEDMRFAAEKVLSGGSERVMLCERGSCFGYRELIVDFRGLSVMGDLGCPVVFDATHAVQVMGGGGGKSSGNRRNVPLLARAAAAVGIDGIFLECHENPDRAPSDGPNMIALADLSAVLEDLRTLHEMKLQTRVC